MKARQLPEPKAYLLAAASFIVFTILYGVTSRIGDHLHNKGQLYFAWESQIPLIPGAAIAYLSVSLMLIPILLRFPTYRQLWPLAVTLAAQQSVAAVIFLLFPLEGGYPPRPEVAGITGAIWEFSNVLALSHNYFPSLHVALSTSAALAIWRTQDTVPWGMLLWAGAVSISTLFVHQHHLADIAGGVLLAWGSVKLVFDRWDHEQ